MSIGPSTALSTPWDRALSLTEVLRQCADIEVLVAESAKGLLAIDFAIKRHLGTPVSPLSTESILKSSEAVQLGMQTASERLSAIVRALANEVKERDMLDLRFAAAVEQAEGGRHASLHDALTGIPNRALFHDRLVHGVAQAKRNGWTLALMFMDLDNFKEVNDRYGHDAGDRVLQTIARRLKDKTRSDDTVSRHGGDEFMYLAMNIANKADISVIAEKIIEEIRAPFEISIGGVPISLSINASIGIATFPKHGADADTLVSSADQAMYRAKQDKSGYSFAP